MTAHELARKLLEGPDLPVILEVGDPVMWVEMATVKPFPNPTGIGSSWISRGDQFRSDPALLLSEEW